MRVTGSISLSERRWHSAPIIDWLLAEGRFLTDTNALISGLGKEMLSAGAPLWRLRLSMRTIHPLIAAVTSMFERDEKAPIYLEVTHGLEGRSGYLGSPLEIVARTRKPYRAELWRALTSEDHDVLHQLKARGATDYIAYPMDFSEETSATLVFVTDAKRGFTDDELGELKRIASVVAPIAETYSLKRKASAVAEAYLGRRTGKRVLSGQIIRGELEEIAAVIIVSDIRDWTGLNLRLTPKAALEQANRYFEIIAVAVESQGGEVLKFMGDGVLAVISSTDCSEAELCEKALRASKLAQQEARKADPPLGFEFGIGIHFGKVFYGNIGSETRLDFTVMGQAVNIASRIESLSSKFNSPVLFSQEVARRVSEPTIHLGDEMLKGQSEVTPIFTIDKG